ncbi:hypothetical protein P280DRAFT_509458 [Massarina eburnea CBS 473.64]|uniref:Uncharacterized protein n=1 Tax=Massarina eburnea CBS 473.64 TaxID=1395130 RepID=A0A6A6RST8_9PLEO|nr:hypothetical protein P280DRAFT_509458 [Massarina eburnea CBS 473.64]
MMKTTHPSVRSSPQHPTSNPQPSQPPPPTYKHAFTTYPHPDSTDSTYYSAPPTTQHITLHPRIRNPPSRLRRNNLQPPSIPTQEPIPQHRKEPNITRTILDDMTGTFSPAAEIGETPVSTIRAKMESETETETEIETETVAVRRDATRRDATRQEIHGLKVRSMYILPIFVNCLSARSPNNSCVRIEVVFKLQGMHTSRTAISAKGLIGLDALEQLH